MDDDRTLAVLRDLPHARLPAVYEAAKVALANCARIDECKDWADKMAALASYAKQANDETLMNHARRVRARAIEREGELLEEIPASAGGRPPSETSGGAPTSFGRMDAAREAGLSKDQAITALRVARVPKEEFEEAVESDDPPTITELARRGTQSKSKPLVDLGDRTPDEFAAATGLIGALNALQRYSTTADLAVAVAGLNAREHAETQATAEVIFRWLDELWGVLNATNTR